MPVLTKELEQRTLRWNRESTQVALARHGFDACVLGGSLSNDSGATKSDGDACIVNPSYFAIVVNFVCCSNEPMLTLLEEVSGAKK